VRSAMCISVHSVKVYVAGVRSAQIDAGLPWALSGNPVVARAMRYIKRRYGMPDKALKVPISLGTLLCMCRHLVGWPSPPAMSHDDRLFVAASVVAVLGFLRGGEFLWSRRSDRPLLRFRDVCCVVRNGFPAVIVSVAQPKARWWLAAVDVVCFDLGKECVLNPVFWLSEYRARSVVRFGSDRAAFMLADGSSLSRDWMVTRTEALMKSAGVALVDSLGNSVVTKASSWRAGGVQSAKQAGVSDAMIKAMGRWSSCAWLNYVFASVNDLQAAACSMWQAAASQSSHPLLVGSFAPSGLFEDAWAS
jgi:hypothetical protein